MNEVKTLPIRRVRSRHSRFSSASRVDREGEYPMKAKVDEDVCAGCAVCVDVCPEVFEMNEDDKAAVIVDVVPADSEDSCRDAADQCPSEAIQVED
jgi:ferredoxin